MLIWLAQMLWTPFWAAGVINGIGHFFGYRTFSTKDTSTNIIPFGIIIGGEELHNAHIVMCGPDSLVKSMKTGLRQHGARHLHVEGFDMRSGIGPDLSRYLDDVVRTQIHRLTSKK